MNLQEELMQLTESYYTNRYNDWLHEHQYIVKSIKECAKKEANKGFFTATISLFLTDEDMFNLKKWLDYTGLLYSFAWIGVDGDVNKYDLYISWDLSIKN